MNESWTARPPRDHEPPREPNAHVPGPPRETGPRENPAGRPPHRAPCTRAQFKTQGMVGWWHDLMRRSRTREPISGSSNQLRRCRCTQSIGRPTLCLLVALHRHSRPPVAAAICYSLLNSLSVHRVRATLLTTLCAAHGLRLRDLERHAQQEQTARQTAVHCRRIGRSALHVDRTT